MRLDLALIFIAENITSGPCILGMLLQGEQITVETNRPLLNYQTHRRSSRLAGLSNIAQHERTRNIPRYAYGAPAPTHAKRAPHYLQIP